MAQFPFFDRSSDARPRPRWVHVSRTAAWVVPLTVLIWIYAEREQISRIGDVSFVLQVRTASPERFAYIPRATDRTVTVELEGPRIKLDLLRQRLAALGPSGLVIDLTPDQPPGDLTRLTTDLLNDDTTFFSAEGIQVVGASPSHVTIRVDEMSERQVTVVAGTTLANLDAPPTFDPPVVRVTGPRAVIERLRNIDALGRLVVYADIPNTPQLRAPGPHDVPDVPLLRPQPDGDPGAAALLTLTPDRVRAGFRIRQAEVTYTLASIPVFQLAPGPLLEEYRAVFEPVVTNITVQGSPELINALRNDALPSKPRAILEFSRDDLPPGTPRMRRLRFDLPAGISVAEADARREIEFRLEPRRETR